MNSNIEKQGIIKISIHGIILIKYWLRVLQFALIKNPVKVKKTEVRVITNVNSNQLTEKP
ncbi:hypothetical protein OW730_18455 [Oceanirhabdus sp. W0125-5]|nr:hypothetical protein [Oceanirhabdus sp. W0125-5]WBW95661.1 hypothetical protein OW730_18455 [Oceanirhabdus sp. W0125-5]